jgi:molybdenum cofactor cytidylyltransferase
MTKSARRSSRKSASAIGVVILGAGASSRMGRPKLLLPWGGGAVVGHLIRQWQCLGARQVAIVCRPHDALLAKELNRLGFPARNRIVNPEPERGMFSSIICAVNWDGWLPALTTWAIVLGDQPHLRLKSLRVLIAFQREHPENICQPSYCGHGRHPVLLPRQAWIELGKTTATDLKEFLLGANLAVLKCPIDDAGLALDLDTQADYKQALSLPNDIR